VVGAVAKLRDEVFRAGAGSVADRARDAASAALSGYLQDLGEIGPGKELNELIETLGKLKGPQRKRLAVATAEVARLLHSREKPSSLAREAIDPRGVAGEAGERAGGVARGLLHRQPPLRTGLGRVVLRWSSSATAACCTSTARGIARRTSS
jgi:hypothetical protein